MTRSALVLAVTGIWLGCGTGGPHTTPRPAGTALRAGAANAPASTASAPASRPAPAAVGHLRINAHPWCRISVDGRDTGMTTPQLHIELPAGPHTIGLVSPETGLRGEISVTIVAGELLTRIVDLRPSARPAAKEGAASPAPPPSP
jgi:hypothetical protein